MTKIAYARIFAKIFLFGVIFFTVFGVRKLIYQFIPGFHEYEAAFFYASDVFLVLFTATFLIFFFEGIREMLRQRIYRLLLIFLFLVVISLFFASLPMLALYTFFRFLLLVGFAGTLAFAIKEGIIRIEFIFLVIAVLAVLQAGIALAQFTLQSDLGLQLLGEPRLQPAIQGVSKVPIEGLYFIRGYGTFPHPNILAAFLIMGLLAAAYFYVRADWKFHSDLYDWSRGVRKNFRIFLGTHFFYVRIGAALGIFITGLGLVFTFSRAGWIAAILGIAVFLFLLVRTGNWKPAFRFAVALIAIGVVIWMNFSWAIQPRAHISSTEPAVTERLAFNDVGFQILKERPLGVGIGNQVFYSVKAGVYERFHMDKVYEWQPIHNIYLLAASEIGILGLLAFLVFVTVLIFNFQFSIFNGDLRSNTEMRSSIGNWKLEIGVSKAMLISLLVFGLFDHFLWTLEPGRIMLWLVIGLVLAASDTRQVLSSRPINQLTD